MQAKRFNLLLLAVLGALVAAGAGAPAAAGSPAPPAAPADSVTLSAARVADLIIDEAYTHLGKPYRYGARGPKAFDCSGFTSYVYRKFGITISHSSKYQATDGRAVEGTYADLQKGDILIFGARGNRRSVGHVGIFIEMTPDGQDFTFIHAATHGGVTVSHIKEEYYAVRFLAARRILPDFDLEVPEPEDNTIDFEAAYGNVFLPIKDTLALGAGDSRIVIFGDGTWAEVAEDGSLAASGARPGRIILNPGGTWQPLPERTSSVRVPSSAVPVTPVPQTAAPAAVTSTVTPGAATEPSPAQPDSAEDEYHVIRSGDTLDKISKTYHTTIDRLCELNGITRKTILHIGRRLRVK